MIFGESLRLWEWSIIRVVNRLSLNIGLGDVAHRAAPAAQARQATPGCAVLEPNQKLESQSTGQKLRSWVGLLDLGSYGHLHSSVADAEEDTVGESWRNSCQSELRRPCAICLTLFLYRSTAIKHWSWTHYPQSHTNLTRLPSLYNTFCVYICAKRFSGLLVFQLMDRRGRMKEAWLAMMHGSQHPISVVGLICRRASRSLLFTAKFAAKLA